jgi:ABC-2 type transport system permease protein
MILAILRAQWLSMRTFRLKAKPASAIFSAVTGLVFYGFWIFAAYAAQGFLSNAENQPNFDAVLSPTLLIVFLYWQITPVITASMGASLDLKKLLVYPVPHAQLFFIEVLLRLTTCVEMLLMLTGITVGIIRNPAIGGWASVPRVGFAASVFVAINLLFSAGLRNLLERFMLRKRVREVIILLIVGISVTPQFLLRSHFDFTKIKQLLSPVLYFPWGAAARIFLNEEVARPAAVLAVFAAVAYVFGRSQFNAGLRFDGHSGKVTKREIKAKQGIIEKIVRYPARFLPDPIGAIFEKETLSLSRMAPFRLIFLMGCSLGVILWLPRVFNGRASAPGFMNENVLTFASGYGVLVIGQLTYFNSFGFDRSAAQTWFSLPVPIGKTILGKNLAAAFFISLELVLTLFVTLLFRVPLTAQKVGESFLVSAIAALYLISFGNITSTRIPRALNPEKVSQGGSSKAMNALIMLCFPLVLSPVVLAYWARSVFNSELVFFALIALAAAAGGVLYWIAMGSASNAAWTRREKILKDLSRGEGPVSVS